MLKPGREVGRLLARGQPLVSLAIPTPKSTSPDAMSSQGARAKFFVKDKTGQAFAMPDVMKNRSAYGHQITHPRCSPANVAKPL